MPEDKMPENDNALPDISFAPDAPVAEPGPYRLADDVALLTALDKSAELKIHAANFLLYGGLLAGHSDGNLDDEEKAYLVESLAPLFDSPEIVLDASRSPETAINSLKQTMKWLKKNGGDVRLPLFRCLVGIVAADERLDENEEKLMKNIIKGLDIMPDEGLSILGNAFL